MLKYYVNLLILSVSSMLLYAVWQLAAAQMTRNFYWKTIPVCDYAYGTPLGQRGNVWSLVACTVECLNTDSCESLTHDTVAKICKLNNESWAGPIGDDCTGNTVIYAEKQLCVNDNGYSIPMCIPGLPVCKAVPGCTSAVNNVRLCDGGGAGVCDPTKGRLEVYYNNTWGTVCDDLYTAEQEAMANFTCTNIGYSIGTPLFSAPFGEGVDPIWMDDVLCTGNESSLLECSHRGWGDHNCGHYEDLGLVCS